MALRILQPHAAVTERIATEVRGMARRSAAESLALGGAADSSLGVAAPHPVFNLSLDSLESPDWMNRVEMTGWRYFVTSEAGVIAVAEASSESAGGTVKGTMTNAGPFVVGTEKALASVEADPQVTKGSFALGLLRVPALYVVALWLRGEGKSSGTDWIVPVAPAPEPLRAGVMMRPNDFIKALGELKRSKDAATPNASASPSN
jgi:hypothetical protein